MAPQISTENQCAGRIQGRLLQQLASQTRCDIQAIVMPAAADPLRDYLHLGAGRQGVQSTDGMPTLAGRFGTSSAPPVLRRLDAEMKVPSAAHGRPASASSICRVGH